MKKLLIVGSNGFAGRYLKSELEAAGYDVYGADLSSKDDKTFAADMLDANKVDEIVGSVKPDGIFNLSGIASPQLAWKDVVQTMHLNVDISVHLAQAIIKHCPSCRLIVIGSANQYDFNACNGLPICESSPQKADDPYSVSKHAQEALLLLLAKRYGLDVLFTRSFNHIGPGQKKGFVVSDFASGIVAVERKETDTLTVGNLNAWRDFSDVRDTARAYRLLYEKGHTGEIYNVGSGNALHIEWILNTLLSFSTASPVICHKQFDSAKPAVCKVSCDYSKLHEHTGFAPTRDIKQTLQDVLIYFRSID